MEKPINDLILKVSGNGGWDGFYLRIASTKPDGETRAKELAEALRPYLRDGVTISTEVEPSRFAPSK